MSGSDNVGGKGAGVTSAASGALLPFTGHNTLAMVVFATALLCGGIVLLSLAVKNILAR